MTAPDVQAAKLDELRQTIALPSDAMSAGAWCEAANEAVLIAVALAARVEQLETALRDDSEPVAVAFLRLLDDVHAGKQRPIEEYIALVSPQDEATLRDLIAGYFASKRQRHLNEASYRRVLATIDSLSGSGAPNPASDSEQRHNPRECWCGIDHSRERV